MSAASLASCTLALLLPRAPAGDLFAIEKVKVGTGSTAQEGLTVLLRDGRIAAVGHDLAVPAGAERIDGSGLTLLPGFIDGFSDFGLVKEERSTTVPGNEGPAQDYGVAAYAETAEASRRGLRPEARARALLAAPEKDAAEKLRHAGFTAVLTAPTDGLMPGQACLVEIADLPPRDAVVNEPGLLLVKFRMGGDGPPAPGQGRGRREGGDFGYPSTLMGSLAHLRQAFLDAQRLRGWREAYRRNPAAIARPPSDSCLDALLQALDGDLRVGFLVDRESDILRALRLAEEFRLKPWIVGGKEAWKCAGELAAGRVPVIASLNFTDPPERKNAKLRKPDGGKREAAREGDAPAKAAAAPDAGEPVPPAAAEAPAAAVPAAPAEAAGSGPVAPTPEEWEIADPVLAEPLELFEQRRARWEEEVRNVERLLAAGVQVALTTRGSSGAADFLADLRVAIEKGLDADAAVAALTRTPAELFGVERELGAVRPGAAANLILVEGELSSKERAVRHAFVAGRHFAGPKKKPPEAPEGKEERGGKRPDGEKGALDLTGTWALTSSRGEGFRSTLTLKQEGSKLTGTLESEMGSAEITAGTLDGDRFSITISAQFQTRTFEFTLKGTATRDSLSGMFETPFGAPSEFEAKRGPGAAAGGASAEGVR